MGLLAILDPHINISVGPSNTCIALKQFNLLPPNTLFWSNFIYYPLTHWFEAITLGWMKTYVKWFWDNFDRDWQTETWVINKVSTYSTPGTLEFKSCPVFPLWPEWSIEVWLTDRRQERQTDKIKRRIKILYWLFKCCVMHMFCDAITLWKKNFLLSSYFIIT